MSKKTKIGVCQSLYWSNFSYEPMRVEVDISRGLFHFNIVGLADKTMTESKYRILSALKNSDYTLPQRKNEKVIVSLLPSDKKKTGTYADLAIAYSYLVGSGQLPHIEKDKYICCIGELALEGSVLFKQDIIHLLYAGVKAGLNKFIIPARSTEHIHLIPNIEIAEIEHLSDLKKPIVFITSNKLAEIHSTKLTESDSAKLDEIEISESTAKDDYIIDTLKGLDYQKRALMIGLAGNHHILFAGLPGCGKSALANCAKELLDPLTNKEAIETYSIYQSAKISDNMHTYKLSYVRPCRKPHSSIKEAGLIGNGSSQQGELSLTHNGTLILNELCEFSRESIECLRDPIENQKLLVHKGGSSANFKLFTTVIATTNICPCGKIPTSYFIDNKLASNPENKDKACSCTNHQINRYQNKISEPLLDRFPIVCTFSYEQYESTRTSMRGADMKNIIERARNISRVRNGNIYNQYLTIEQITEFGIDKEGEECIKEIEPTFKLSKRKILHTLRLARTIADIEESEEIHREHILEAVGYVKTKPFAL